MSDTPVRTLLSAMRQAASCYRLYGPEHKLTVEQCADLAASAARLTRETGHAIVTVVDETLYLDRAPLTVDSIDYSGVIRRLHEIGVESISFEAPIRSEDCAVLAAFVAGSEEPPAGGSIVLNGDSWTRTEVDDEPAGGLRQAYTSSVGALRSIGGAIQSGTRFELAHASAAVVSLLEQVVARPEAAFLLTTVKSHHEYTFFHSVNTAILALGLGRLIGLDEDDQLTLGLGALLHDIGKIGVPATVLQHPGRLAPEDWNEIKRHPVVGAEMILSAAEPGKEASAVVAFEHHAGYDGAGYPTIPHPPHLTHGRSKSGADLHLFSRLTAVVDTYDAITTRRSYRRAENPSRALQVLLNGAGRSHDPDAVQAFIGLMGVYPPGSRLRLHDGRIAVVIRSISGEADRPNAAAIVGADGDALENPELIQIDARDIADQVAITRQEDVPTELLDLLGDVS